MKTACIRFIALALISILCLSSAALAEEAPALSDRLYDLQVKLGDKVYSCATTIDGLKEQGLRFEKDELQPGYYYNVNNGRASFMVLVDALDRNNAAPEDIYVCGYLLDASAAPNAEIIHGVVVGEATRKTILDAFGWPSNDYGNHMEYSFHRNYIGADFQFEGDADDSKLKEVRMHSRVPLCYGLEVSDQAGVEEEGLPAPTDFAFDQFILDGKLYEGKFRMQDLLDNGWRLSARDADEELKAQGDKSYFISVSDFVLFNGKTMIRAYVYNDASGEGTCKPAEAAVCSVGVNVADETGIILADGITNGSTLDEVTAVYGTNYETEDFPDSGYTKYKFQMGNSVLTTFNVMDGVVVYIEIQTGI